MAGPSRKPAPKRPAGKARRTVPKGIFKPDVKLDPSQVVDLRGKSKAEQKRLIARTSATRRGATAKRRAVS